MSLPSPYSSFRQGLKQLRSVHKAPARSIVAIRPSSSPLQANLIAKRPKYDTPKYHRSLSSTIVKYGESSSSQPPLTQAEYEKASDRDMNLLHENLEILVEQYAPAGWEVEYDSGVMTLTLPPHGTYVINKQPPNQQIWISSPISGPSRFSFNTINGKWTHHRKEVFLGGLIESEIRQFKEVQDGWQGVGIE